MSKKKLIQLSKAKAFSILSVLFIFFLFLLFNKTLVLHISSALSDWYDYPLMVYILQQNIQHISTLDFMNFGNISMFYPTPGGKYFTDLLLPQSILGLFIFPFTEDYITTHNLVFLAVGLLNIISLQFFWNKVFKDKKTIFLLTLLFTFSPYVFTMYAHYQMISYWFFFFSLGVLLTAKKRSEYVFAGFLSGLQFLAAVYIGIYSLTISGIFFLLKMSTHIQFKNLFRKKYKKAFDSKALLKSIQQGSLFFLGFLVIAGYFVFKFVQIQRVYEIERSADTYINHSMQITDFFFNPLPSFWVESFYKKINVHNHRLGGETFGTGFILLIVVTYGIKKLRKSSLTKKERQIFHFFMLLLGWGIIAVLGPRLSLNGKYLAIPLPYIFPLKLTPFFSALRVISRWFFVVQVGMFYYVGVALNSIFKSYTIKKAIFIITLITALYILEIVPIKQRTAVDTYRDDSYNYLISECQVNDVLLEYPFAPEQPKTHVLITLNYWTKMLLNNMHYDCQLVNGYSGFQPKHIDDFIHNFRTSVENSKSLDTYELLNQKDVTYIKFNKKLMLEESIDTIHTIFTNENYQTILENNEFLIVKYDI